MLQVKTNIWRSTMLRDFFTNKWILGGVGFLIVLFVACVLWYQHNTAADRQAAAKTEIQLQQSKIAYKTTANYVTNKVTKHPAENTARPAVKPITQTTDKVVETSPLSDESLPSSTQQAEEKKDIAAVSPHGFGPYPELPSDYPAQDLWNFPDFMSADAELMHRVAVKLWKQGTRSIGGMMADGLVYPTIPGTVYIEWDRRVLSNGTEEKVVSAIRGDPFMGQVLRGIERQKGRLVESDIPSDIMVENGGIDPYEFLSLKNKEINQ